MPRDPITERIAIELAWCDRIPAFLLRLDQQTEADKRAWWEAIGEMKCDGYRYRADVAIEAYQSTEGLAHAAE